MVSQGQECCFLPRVEVQRTTRVPMGVYQDYHPQTCAVMCLAVDVTGLANLRLHRQRQ